MNRAWLALLLLPGLLCGCSKRDPPPASPISLDPAVKVVHAQYRTVNRTVEQPGVIGAYERTALYAKDYRNVAAALSEYNSPAPVSSVIQQLVNAMMAKGQGEVDYSALATVLFDLAGLDQPAVAGT